MWGNRWQPAASTGCLPERQVPQGCWAPLAWLLPMGATREQGSLASPSLVQACAKVDSLQGP